MLTHYQKFHFSVPVPACGTRGLKQPTCAARSINMRIISLNASCHRFQTQKWKRERNLCTSL